MMAIENLSATTLRNIIGELDLDTTLTSRDIINTKMRAIIDEATDPWGIKVNRVEVKNIMPPEAIREAMEKQMRAERERRALRAAARRLFRGRHSGDELLHERQPLADCGRSDVRPGL